MKTLTKLFFLSVGITALCACGSASNPNLHDNMPADFTRNASRPCFYQTWVKIDSDNSGANLSAELNDWTTYVIQCDADAYIEWGTSTAAASNVDGWLAGGAWIRFGVESANRYVSVLNKVHATADCWIIECK